MLKIGILFSLITAMTFQCAKDKAHKPTYKANKCVILLIDGPRYQETWGDNTHQYVPHLYNDLKSQGCIFTNFQNNGPTFTIPGHTAILTGYYQAIANDGSQLPNYPGLPQLFLEKNPGSKVDVITSKDKIEVLSNCLVPEYKDKFKAYTDCGINGWGTGYREDSVTMAHVREKLAADHPDFLFIQLKQPDAAGHANDWPKYLQGIVDGDAFAAEVWSLLQGDDYYKDQTIFIVTNDHGRHDDGTADGFISHGDACNGCKHINLFMAGPDFKKDLIIDKAYEQIDIHKTVTQMLSLKNNYGTGKFIKEIMIE